MGRKMQLFAQEGGIYTMGFTKFWEKIIISTKYVNTFPFLHYHYITLSQKSRGNTVAYTVENGPVKKKDTLCNEQQNEIAVLCTVCGTWAVGTGIFMDAVQVFWSSKGCVTSRTDPSFILGACK